MLLFFISFLALTSAPSNYAELGKMPQFQVEKAAFFVSFLFSKSNDAASTLLNQTTRTIIFNFIRDNPGFHFRAMAGALKMPIGVLEYHLGLLTSRGFVSQYQDGRFRRYFESKKFTEAEMKIVSVLRHRVSGMILMALLRRSSTRHRDLAKQVNVSSQALSWHMKRLEGMLLVKRNVEELRVNYSLDETYRAIVDRCAVLVN
jgi:predicted transcriptional regulator